MTPSHFIPLKKLKCNLSMSLVLVTGGAGFVGSFLSFRLLSGGCRVLFLVRKKHGIDARNRIKDRLLKISSEAGKYENSWEVVEGDVTKPLMDITREKLESLDGKIHRIYHCAANLDFYPSDEDSAYAVNVGGAKNAIELADLLGAELHYLSTAYISGDRKGEIGEKEFDEGQGFRNIYDKAKFEAEKVVKKWFSEGGRGVIYRPSIAIGDSETGVAFSFTGYYVLCRFFLRLAKMLGSNGGPSELPLPIPVARKSTLNLISVDVVADAIVRISENTMNLGSTFHIVHPNPPYNAAVFESSLRRLGFPKVKIFQVSLLTLHLLVRTGWLFSWLFGKNGGLFRHHIVAYLSYFDGSATFKAEGVLHTLGRSFSPPQITDEVIEKVLSYAIKMRFSDDDQI